MDTPNPSAWSLLVYGGWTLSLLGAIAAHRVWLVLRGRRRANSFSPWGDDVSPLAARLCRAHANCVENLPVFGAVVLAAVMLRQTPSIDTLAPWLVGARVLQSAVHLASVSTRAVSLRFAFMAAQLALLAAMIGQLCLACL